MKNITPDNIDEWMFEHFEGNLNLDETSQLMDFLQTHPEFQEDLDLWSNLQVQEPEMIYPNADQLMMEPNEGTRRPISAWSAAAAVVLLLGTAGTWAYFSSNNFSSDGYAPVASNVDASAYQTDQTFYTERSSSSSRETETTALASNTLVAPNQAAVHSTQHAEDRLAFASNFATHSASVSGGNGVTSTNNGFGIAQQSPANATSNTPSTAQQSNGNSLVSGNGSALAQGNVEGTATNPANGTHGNTVAVAVNDHQATQEDNHVNANEQPQPKTSRTSRSGEGRFADPDWAKRVVKTYTYESRSHDRLHEYAANGQAPRASKSKRVTTYPGFRVPSGSLAFNNTRDQHFMVRDGNPLQVNPAFSGDAGSTRLLAGVRNRRSNGEGIEQDYLFSYDQPIEALGGGIGVLAYRDEIAPESSVNYVGLSYAYRLSLGKNLTLQPALRMSYTHHQSEAYQSGSMGYRDFGFGMALHAQRFYAGLAVDHLMEPGETLIDPYTGNEIRRRYSAQVATDLVSPIEGKWSISPHILLDSDLDSYNVWGGSIVRYGNLMMGVGASTESEVRGTLGMQTEKFRVGYTYNRSFDDLLPFTSTTHELGVQLLLK